MAQTDTAAYTIAPEHAAELYNQVKAEYEARVGVAQ